MCRVVDLDAVLLVSDLLVEIGGQAIALGDQALQDTDAWMIAPSRRTTIPLRRFSKGLFNLYTVRLTSPSEIDAGNYKAGRKQ